MAGLPQQMDENGRKENAGKKGKMENAKGKEQLPPGLMRLESLVRLRAAAVGLRLAGEQG